jgi:hypothetical protein
LPGHAVAAADELMYQVKREARGTVSFSVIGDSASDHAQH